MGGSHAKNLDFAPVSPLSYARAAVENGLSMVFYTEDVEDEERLVDFVSRFIRCMLKYEEVHRRPVLLIVEEAQEYAPEKPSGRVAPSWVYQRMTKAFKDCFLQGRKLARFSGGRLAEASGSELHSKAAGEPHTLREVLAPGRRIS